SSVRTGGVSLALGDGASNVNFNHHVLTVGGSFKILAGDHAGQSTFNVNTGHLNLSGPLSMTFAGGDNQSVVAVLGSGRLPAVQVLAGSGIDEVDIVGGSSDLIIGPVTFNGGNGT